MGKITTGINRIKRRNFSGFKFKEEAAGSGENMATMWKLLLIFLLVGRAICEDIDLSSRPTLPTPAKEKSVFDQIVTKNSEKQKSSSLGRSSKERVKLIQGDIVVDDDEDISNLGRTANKNIRLLKWPRKIWNTREVPYVIENFYRGSKGWNAILAAFRAIEKVTCVKYRPKTYADKRWIRVYDGPEGCWASIGRRLGSGATKVSIGCSLSQNLIIHELVHALGFFHEQSRRDRDNYVRILTWNVQSKQLYNFNKAKKREISTFGLPYDYKSLMHYSRTTWTKDGKNTMEAKNDPNLDLGGQALTNLDIAKINAMYHCHERSGQIWTEWSDWSVCIRYDKKCYQSKHRICLSKNPRLCPEADEWGVQSIGRQCQSYLCDVEQVHGFWGQWQSWSRCTKSCDRGTKVRYRKCDSPKPSYGGKDCKGPQSDTEKCMLKRCIPNGFDQTFENGMGGWTNVGGHKDPLDWRLGKGRMNPYSGPTEDHTTGNGWYLYVSSQPHQHKKRATIQSPLLSGKKCIRFAYLLNGKNMGQLDVFGQTTSGGWLLWGGYSNNPRLKGHKGKDWQHGEIPAGRPGIKWRLFFEAQTGFGPYSDVAIDDVFIDDGDCNEVKQTQGKTPVKKVFHGCVNKNKGCGHWASIGECHFNKVWMPINCCLACRAMGDCNKPEYSKECKYWAQTGECQKNSGWMWKNCCKSCREKGQCTKDLKKDCRRWANQGYCSKKKNEIWMWKHCCKACAAKNKS